MWMTPSNTSISNHKKSIFILLSILFCQINGSYNQQPTKNTFLFSKSNASSRIQIRGGGGEKGKTTTTSAIPSLSELTEESIQANRKIIVVTGGVLSGIGKGVTASSIGVLLRSMGLRVTALKIDPYLNVDAGTMSPFEHGEVFVLDDGGECDLDLGNYERFLSVSLTKNSNLSTGKIYQVSAPIIDFICSFFCVL